MSSRTNGVKVGLLVGIGVVVLLFAGQVLSFAARWLGRAISGAAILLLAIGIGYIAYQLYSGWSVTEDENRSQEESAYGDDERAFEMDRVEEDTTSRDEELSDQELEEELERLSTETETTDTESIRESN